MNILFVHQNFPGQFRHLAPHLQRLGHQVQALGIGGPGLPGGNMRRYKPRRLSSDSIHPWVREFEIKVIRGDACAHAARALNTSGFRPDVTIANPGWGESIYLKQAARLVAVERYDLETVCLPKQVQLVESLADGAQMKN